MPHESRTEQIRNYISNELVRLGADVNTSLRETLLIRSGNYCGHRFKLGQFHAVWFIDEDQIKFSGPEGMIQSVQPSVTVQANQAARVAA